MTDFSLAVSDLHLLIELLRQPPLLLLLTSNVLDRSVTHCFVDTNAREEALIHVHPPVESGRSNWVIFSEIFLLVDLI